MDKTTCDHGYPVQPCPISHTSSESSESSESSSLSSDSDGALAETTGFLTYINKHKQMMYTQENNTEAFQEQVKTIITIKFNVPRLWIFVSVL